ncbi:MAG TPA: DUF6356 family protein [Erythrobacter sp.]|nr:DUF6356 family protein [Erythrobacter sp.]
MDRSTIAKAFTEHPASVGETYGEHLVHATGFGVRMVLGGLACMLHGFLPFLFVKTGSKQIETLHGKMIVNRSKLPQPLDFVI